MDKYNKTFECDKNEPTFTFRFSYSPIVNLYRRCDFSLFAAIVIVSINHDRCQVSVLSKQELSANSVRKQPKRNSNSIFATIPEFNYIMTWKKCIKTSSMSFIEIVETRSRIDHLMVFQNRDRIAFVWTRNNFDTIAVI